MKYQIGVAGLAVMGRGLALNLAEHGFAVAGYNRSSEPTEIFVEAGKAAGYTSPAAPRWRSSAPFWKSPGRSC